ncbi:Fe(3+) ABC transporter substrate-binding protein [Candidatus Albibeggiatoa sp. nov. NOAA]|uniref:Fe(3+) ABC transporter substrate-binding protein n=1 Tax=Candidatus Albibeggiatoa sp. nov. NOAA TaxID=3162724 RepID=UPI0032FD6CB0|nr:Fe(3+) ABC transporter substrate-binding protein [Thiotrichaceae bacterium]
MYRTLLVNTILVYGLSLTFAAQATNHVNLYSARKEVLIRPLLNEFTAQTGVTVNIVTGKADILLKRLIREGRNSPADILLTTDAGRLHRAKQAQVLQSVESNTLKNEIPAHYRDPDGTWYGLSLRARVIMYAKDRIKPNMLSSYEDLQHKRWHKRICVRSSSNIYNQSLVASIIAANGTEKAKLWANGFVGNLVRTPAGGDRDQIKAVAVGLCDLAIVNTYYLGGMLQADKRQQRAAQQIAVFWPNQSNRGAHVNISGAGVTKSARNKDNAIKLLEFLTSDSAQEWYAKTNHEFPIKEGVTISNTLKAWGEFKADTLSLSKLGELNPAAVRLMDYAGWR